MNRYSISAILSGVCFGLTGLFTRRLTGMGMSTMGILAVRCTISALCFFLMAAKNVSQLRIHKKDLLLFLAVGIAGQGFFSLCYYSAINMMSVSTACIILYLYPVFVTIIARFVFHDPVTKRVVLAIVLCVAGCACVSGFGGTISFIGVVCGLGAALSFGLINILDRMILQRGYTGTAVNFWICAIAAVMGIILDPVLFPAAARPLSVVFGSFGSLILALVYSLITGFLAYIFFSHALSGCESGKVSILASTEPVTAALVSVFVFHEKLGIVGVLGLLLVLGGIILQNTGTKGGPAAE